MVVAAEELETRQLFGGMASMQCPARLVDISDFRPVPDHQEVLTDASADQSVIVEILDRANVSDEESASFFWQDCCSANEATDVELEQTSPSGRGSAELPNSWPSSSKAYAIRGRICASKGRQANEAANIVQVLLEVIRLPHVGSDVVITLNTPMVVSERSAAAQDTGAGPKTLHHAAPELFRRMTASFAIHDWSLFGGD